MRRLMGRITYRNVGRRSHCYYGNSERLRRNKCINNVYMALIGRDKR